MERANSHSSQHIAADEDTLLDQLSALIAIYKTALDRKTVNDVLRTSTLCHTQRLPEETQASCDSSLSSKPLEISIAKSTKSPKTTFSNSRPRSNPLSTPIMYTSPSRILFYSPYKKSTVESTKVTKTIALTLEQEAELQRLLNQWQTILNPSSAQTPKKEKRNSAKETERTTSVASSDSFIPERSIFLDALEYEPAKELDDCSTSISDTNNSGYTSNEPLDAKLDALANEVEKFFESIAPQSKQSTSSHTTSVDATAVNLPKNWFN